VLITPDGRVVLLDFGLAVDSVSDLTMEKGLLVGTPGYMSPEQIAMQPVTPASDWYAFGVMLYQGLTGHRPFHGQGAEMLEQQLRGVAVPASVVLPGLPDDLASLADRCMERDPARRPSEPEILLAFGSELVEPRPSREHERLPELVGRGRELRTLLRHVTQFMATQSGVVLLHGSPGIGKTSVADHLLNDVRAKTDALIIGGRCHGWESLPFNAIDAIVDSVARAARADFTPAVERVVSQSVAMTRLFPTLDFPSGVVADDDTLMLPPTPNVAHAARELHALLAALAGDRALVLFLDDAQWGDYQSAKVFLALLAIPSPLRIVLVLTYCTEDWRTSLLLQTIVGSTVPRAELHLETLSASMLDRIVKGMRPDESKAFRERVVRDAEGNPGLLMKILREGGSLDEAVQTQLAEMSESSRRVFAMLRDAEGPLPEDVVERGLELFESDEPLRTLTREQLIRLRRTGDLLELDVYHPRLRSIPPAPPR
jgi:hypothetical protein